MRTTRYTGQTYAVPSSALDNVRRMAAFSPAILAVATIVEISGAARGDGPVNCWGWNESGQCNIPADLVYAKSHEWLRAAADGTATIGITDYAQSSLGDITFVQLPKVGATLKAGETFHGLG